MLFNYRVLDASGVEKAGSIDAVSEDVAIVSLQRRGFTISAIQSVEAKESFLSFTFFNQITNRDIVILSRQIAVLFEAQVSALRVFRLLAAETEKPPLAKALTAVADDLQSGFSISKALEKHPKAFSPFYINMVHAGEEAGTLGETLLYLADYLDRSYEVTSKARNALIYPAFVVTTFITVMVLMLPLIIPKLSVIVEEVGQEVSFYTKIVIGVSTFFVDYGLFFAGLLVLGGFAAWRYSRTKQGNLALSEFKLTIHYVGSLYRKLYLSRIADNLSTMLTSGITMVQAIEITATVVGNGIYERLLNESAEAVKSGKSVSEALGKYEEIPGIVVQMVKIGEETGELGTILKTLAKFYQREVTNAVDTLVDLIEPTMIVALGLGVGLLLMAILVPIYNLASAF